MRKFDHRLRRTVTTYALLLATAVVLMGGVLLATLDRRVSTVVILSSIGVNLVASALFALIFSLISGRLQETLWQQSVKDGITEISSQVVTQIGQMNQLFIPQSVYPAINPSATDFGIRYNDDVTRSLIRSNSCYFRGTSAWFVAARIANAIHKPQTVKVAILDPRDDRAMNRRAADRTAQKSSGPPVEKVQLMLVEEIAMSVLALFDCRRFGPIEISYDADPSVYRYEIYDDSMYLSWFHGPDVTIRDLPQSYRFAPESFCYRTMYLDFIRRFDAAGNKVRFDETVDEEFLVRHISDTFGAKFDAEEIARLRAEYASKIREFAEFLRERKGGE